MNKNNYLNKNVSICKNNIVKQKKQVLMLKYIINFTHADTNTLMGLWLVL